MKVFALILLSAFAFSGGHALAQNSGYTWNRNDLVPRTPLDYTLDDGVMTPEEMEMEAQDMYRLCQHNIYQRRLFNCECLAGAFLQQREKLGPMVEQYDVFKIITNSRQARSSCANTEEVAGQTFRSCLRFAENYSRTEFDEYNEDYCTCVANKTAHDFTKTPRLSASYVQTLRANAMNLCRTADGRRRLQAEIARDEAEAGAAGETQSNSFLPDFGKSVN